MSKEEITQPDGSPTERANMLQNVGAMIAGLIAVRVVTYIVTTIWRLVTREEPPQIDQAVRPAKKAAWIALIGASTGAARQMARDKIKPPVDGAA
ncbi:MAG: hypothetical protein QOG04_1623 [Actinomycetota bacterium]|jgi:hypothetical protein|nr:hypothetical protein [Actinomycetota bacterium]